MSSEFNSRRARREAEAQTAALAFTPVSAPPYFPPVVAPQVAPVVVAPQVSPQLSRREMRQQQAVQIAVQQVPLYSPIPTPVETVPVAPAPVAPSPVAPSPVAPSPVAPAPVAPSPVAPAPVAPAPVAPAPVALAPSRRDLRDQLRQPAEPITVPVTPFAQPWSEPAVTPMFETSSGFSIDTTTNSIVLPITPDALSGPMIIDSGVTLHTGSIELPNLNTGTGSIALPTAAQIADDALSLDSASSFVSNIAPIAARNLIKKHPKLGLAPVKAKGSQGQLFYGLTTSFLMLTVGGLLVVAWMYGVIK